MDAKAPHRTDNIHPAPVTDLVNGLPPEIRFRRIPSVTRSSSPDRSTTVWRALASSLAQESVSVLLKLSRLSTPCSVPVCPKRALASPKLTGECLDEPEIRDRGCGLSARYWHRCRRI